MTIETEFKWSSWLDIMKPDKNFTNEKWEREGTVSIDFTVRFTNFKSEKIY